MGDIAKQVFSWIKERPYIEYALKKGIVNYSSLSRMIQKDLNVRNFDAVIVAARRYKTEVLKSTGEEIMALLRKSRLEIKTGVNVYIVRSLDEKINCLHMIKGSNATTIITQKKLDISCIRKNENVVEVNIISGPELERTMGFTSYVYSALFERGINILETYSCYTDTILIFDKKDLSKVVDILEEIGVK